MSDLKCLVLMPFAEDFDNVFKAIEAAVRDAIPNRQISCEWLKSVLSAGSVTDDIVRGIDHASLCVADLTGSNPNVMWETGYAMASRKPTILISQDVEQLPFDLRVHRVLAYDRNDIEALAPQVAEAVRQTVSRHSISAKSHFEIQGGSSGPVIAVTGSMNVHRARAMRRVQSLLSPYLPLNPVWYCGSNGDSDEVAVEWLVEANQNVATVGYNQFDISGPLVESVNSGKVQFLDASIESVPKGLSGPTERDVFFAAKADLVVLIWDGVSSGTGELIEYYKENAKNLLLGFA